MSDFDRYKVMKAKRMVSVSPAFPLNSYSLQNVTNHVFFSLSAEEQDYQAWGEEAAEGGSKEVNYHKINLLFNCSTVS